MKPAACEPPDAVSQRGRLGAHRTGQANFFERNQCRRRRCASCHHNRNKLTNGEIDVRFQDYNIHEPGVVSETTVDTRGPVHAPLTISSQRSGHLRTKEAVRTSAAALRNTCARESVPRWLHHSDARSLREILLPPDSPFLRPGERGFNFRTVRADHQRRVASGKYANHPSEVPITFGDSRGGLAGDGKGRGLCQSRCAGAGFRSQLSVSRRPLARGQAPLEQSRASGGYRLHRGSGDQPCTRS
jgi:hypothetical protein